MSATRQSTELRQAEIIATMIRLSAERNPAEITTTEISVAMGITQGALFRHYSTKEAIRVAVVEWIEGQLMAELLAAKDSAVNPLDALSEMFMTHFRFTQTYPGVPRLVFAELQQPETSPVRQRVQGLMQRYRKTIAQTLADAMTDKLIHPDIDRQSAAALFLGAIQGLVIQSMLTGASEKGMSKAKGVLNLYLAGLGVPR